MASQDKAVTVDETALRESWRAFFLDAIGVWQGLAIDVNGYSHEFRTLVDAVESHSGEINRQVMRAALDLAGDVVVPSIKFVEKQYLHLWQQEKQIESETVAFPFREQLDNLRWIPNA